MGFKALTSFTIMNDDNTESHEDFMERQYRKLEEKEKFINIEEI